ncbi:uncharacterized protein Z519_09666 [Cladophialophora bantiana CBS 173.52]|uniref:Uncharacterized protein n=1 Tax=Cladophialophora bantiana (strain ATCC 10958 / CBS 173.52 / CDC B-1940 / NIH 8579) TaxID=1442370 RepID=A0A0D2HFJ8_CLAB1|nr:uncharacterized protein Z519_09666 [Cladophialophora bantiana CBS 173.52]KIW89510.1 hypothetical protein Z519_09666 [Cladophialophora bantiana CBS 173.52]
MSEKSGDHGTALQLRSPDESKSCIRLGLETYVKILLLLMPSQKCDCSSTRFSPTLSTRIVSTAIAKPSPDMSTDYGRMGSAVLSIDEHSREPAQTWNYTKKTLGAGRTLQPGSVS